jgi:predicted ATP-grasp superfamily ATP-dependent carboligase
LFDIEFIYDSRDSQYKLIEINPRTTLSNSHSESCGINIPYITYCDLQGIEYNQKQEQKDAIYWIYFWIDSGSFYRKLKKKQITPIEWISSILKARSFAVWAKDDIKPFLVFIFKSLANLMGI